MLQIYCGHVSCQTRKLAARQNNRLSVCVWWNKVINQTQRKTTTGVVVFRIETDWVTSDSEGRRERRRKERTSWKKKRKEDKLWINRNCEEKNVCKNKIIDKEAEGKLFHALVNVYLQKKKLEWKLKKKEMKYLQKKFQIPPAAVAWN